MAQLTFQSLCRKLKSGSSLKSHAEELNTLTGAIASLIENPVAGSIAAFIEALSEKEKLICLGSTVLNAILNQVSMEDYSGRVKQMEEAYGIIYFTAFFDELDSRLPDNIRRSIQLSLKEKKNLFRSSALQEEAGHSNGWEIIFPDIVCGYDEVEGVLQDMYGSMANRFRDFVRGLSFQDVAGEKDIRSLDEVVKELPKAAIKRFHDQYLTLCGKFNEFYIFVQLENERKKELKWDDRYKNILSIAMRSQTSSEAGLANLKKIIMDLPNQIKEEKVQEIVDGLIKTYQSSIDRPLIETKDGEENLTYPLISKAFIPQTYKLLQYSGKERLEQSETWKDLDPKQNMMSFWAKYCLDPSSVERLLLILGEPGGGKSLLTKVLCARMIAPMNICIRIPLREHDVEEEIESIVCKQITQDGDASDPIRTFKSFAEEFQGSPITLLFDGYDEVMQATGGVYRNLLTRIRQFQERCQEQERPVRVIVTSRETLIDKADIPKKTIVMKLLEFDEPQKDQWIRIWNEHNHTALAEVGIRDFILPEGNKSIKELSGQPLLLLMLAIYDANFETGTNALKQTRDETESMDRTKLYDELLRRFIRRELRKGPKGQDCPYEEATPEERDAMVDEEMKKLGIAALGMFVREKLSLKVGELEDDLTYMNAKATKYDNRNKKMLKSAEAVFGSFFFIHDSRTENEEDEKEAAFEFLHKTFYEFLVADLILQYLIDAVDDLRERKRSSRRGEAFYWDALDRPDSQDNAYYAALNSSCLCIEPEIIQMIAEWKDSKQIKYFQGKCPNFVEEMGQVLSDLFHKHMDIIRTGVFVPLTEKKGGLAGGKNYPQACAIYLMNLIILQILTSGEFRIKVKEWNYISQFLKLNVPLPQSASKKEFSSSKIVRKLRIGPYEEIILKFMDLFQLKREDEDIILIKKTQIDKLERENLQEAQMDILNFMQDDVTKRVYQLHNSDNSLEQKQNYRFELEGQGFDFGFELVVEQMRIDAYHLAQCKIYHLYDKIHHGYRCLRQNRVDAALVLDWLLYISRIIDKMVQITEAEDQRLDDQKRSYWPEFADTIFELYGNEKEVVSVFLEITKKLGYGKALMYSNWLRYAFTRRPYHVSNLEEVLAEIIPAISQDHMKAADFYYLNIDPIQLQDIDSPKVVAALLNFLYMVGRIRPSDLIGEVIHNKWIYYFKKSPEEMPALLKVYLGMGEFDSVKNFFRNIENTGTNWISKLLYQNPNSIVEYLKVAQAVRQDWNFGKRIIQCLREKSIIMDAVSLKPDIIIPLLRHGLLSNPACEDKRLLTEIFLERYHIVFDYNPEQAIYLLYQIDLKQIDSINRRDRFLWGYIYSMKHYNLVLDTSVKAAAQLLTLFEKKNEFNFLTSSKFMEESLLNVREMLPFYVMCCFNKVLFTRDRTVISALECLLDALLPDVRVELEGYFSNQFPFLQAYSLKLSKKVKAMYRMD